MAPGRAPRTNIAEGMVKTPVAKMTLKCQSSSIIEAEVDILPLRKMTDA